MIKDNNTSDYIELCNKYYADRVLIQSPRSMGRELNYEIKLILFTHDLVNKYYRSDILIRLLPVIHPKHHRMLSFVKLKKAKNIIKEIKEREEVKKKNITSVYKENNGQVFIIDDFKIKDNLLYE